ncbi:hypothetical protein GGI04_003084 [Coemansia thaxteri]|nr:hypothetical protein GGI04_003084 [Coemansia thaxteri]
MVWASFAPKTWAGRVLTTLAFMLSVAGSLVVIANRAHYTIDVLLAWYIAPGSWYTVAWFWFWHVTRKGRLLRIEFPVEVGRHRDADSAELCRRRRVELGLMPDGSAYDPVALFLAGGRGEPMELTPAASSAEKQAAGPEDAVHQQQDGDCVVTVGGEGAYGGSTPSSIHVAPLERKGGDPQ